MKHKIITVILILALVISFTGIATADTALKKDIPIFIDGVQLMTSQQPFIRDGKLFAPMSIFETMGAKVEYEPQEVILTKGLIKMRLGYYGAPSMFINGQINTTDANPVDINGTVFAPLRTVSEALFLTVEWKNGSVYINSNKTGYEEYPGVPSFGKMGNLSDDKICITESAITLGPQLKSKAAQIVHLYPVEAAKKDLIPQYQNELVNSGYELLKTDKRDDSYNTTIYYYYNKDNGSFVNIHQVGTYNYVVGICITVQGSLEGLGLKATD